MGCGGVMDYQERVDPHGQVQIIRHLPLPCHQLLPQCQVDDGGSFVAVVDCGGVHCPLHPLDLMSLSGLRQCYI